MTSFALYRRMFVFLRPYLWRVGLVILLSLLVVLFETISLWFTAPLVKTMFLPDTVAPVRPELTIQNAYGLLKYYTYTLIQGGNVLASLKLVCVLMAASFILKNILIYAKKLVDTKTNLLVVRDMRDHIYAHTLKLPVAYYDRNKSGKLLSLVLNDVTAVKAALTDAFEKMLIEPVRVIFFISMLFAISAKLTLVVLVIFPVLGLLITKIGAAVRRRSKRMLESLAGLMSILNETMFGIRTVKMFSMNEVETAKFRQENRRYVRNAFRSSWIGGFTGPLTEVVGVLVMAFLLWYGGREVLMGKGVGAEDFVLFLVYLFSTFKPLKEITGLTNVMQTGFAAAERVFTILDTPTENLSPAASAPTPAFTQRVSFDRVCFSYPGCSDQVLHDVSFTIEKGRTVALVGSSGSGKSTILDLLPRFYDISSGSIAIDGVDLRDMSLAGLRTLFGIVAQETVLFNDTVHNNISYGSEGATPEQVKQAAEMANAWEFIEKMPQGLQTQIGERGEMLSGGQRQRLSIARALLRNPPILILDEATSSLDTESERLVQSAINTLMANRTAVVVAHRLSTILHADKILVLDQGRIIEQGTHLELLALNNRYRYFYDMQFSEHRT